MSELNGKISTSAELRATINPNTRLKGLVSVGGVLIDTTFDKRGLKGETGEKGDTGDTGNGIESIEKTSTSGLVDTYTITYTDGTETTFDLTNGQDGADGQDGHSSVVTATKSGGVTTIYIDGVVAATIDDGQDGADGYSPSASVSKVGHTATITITDKDGTTTAEVHDGSGGGASAFVAEYGVTTYADIKDAYDEDAIIICTVDDSGNTAIHQLAYFDDANDIFYFAQPQSDGLYLAIIGSDDTWDDSYFSFASTDTATQLRNGLMDALDKQKLDGIASGAEVNVNADWNAVSGDAQILNKPSIPTKVSDLNNDSGFITSSSLPSNLSDLNNDMDVSDFPNDAGYITGYTETDPVFTASDAYGITSSDITDWDNSYDGKVSLDTSAASGTDHDLYAAIVALGWQNDVIE